MPDFEYKVVPAPRRAKRVKGAKDAGSRFAGTLAEVLNDEAKGGWEYYRSESLPIEDKKGPFRSAIETYQAVLIFRRRLGPTASELDAPILPFHQPREDEPTVVRPIRGEDGGPGFSR